MKMTNSLATLLTILATTGPLLSATEVEQLRKLCAEQEMQIAQLERKISHITNASIPVKESNTLTRPSPQQAQTQQPQWTTTSPVTYRVKPGDSLQRIANRNNISLSALAALNEIKPNAIIHPNQEIIISKGKTTDNRQTSGVTHEQKAAAPTPSPAPAPATAGNEVYKIQPGDTLYKISKKYGVSVNHLMNSNPNIRPTNLRVGNSINITRQAEQTPAPASLHARRSAPSLTSSSPSIPITNTPAPVERRATTTGPIKINTEITYHEFAQNYQTTTTRLDQLNGLSLDPSTVLAQGSELYIPAQP